MPLISSHNQNIANPSDETELTGVDRGLGNYRNAKSDLAGLIFPHPSWINHQRSMRQIVRQLIDCRLNTLNVIQPSTKTKFVFAIVVQFLVDA